VMEWDEFDVAINKVIGGVIGGVGDHEW
jgi:hypothetical protein